MFEGGNYGAKKTRKAECPSCLKIQRVDTLYEKEIPWRDEGADIDGVKEYYVFQCRGCETVFFSKCNSNSENYICYFDHETGIEVTDYPYSVNVWPKPFKPKIIRLDHFSIFMVHERTANLLRDFYKAADCDLSVLAAIAARTVLDCASEHLGVDPKLPFSDKLEELRKMGSISGPEKGSLEILVDAGGAAAHRGWEPSMGDLETIAEVLNSFIDRTFIQPEKIKKLKKNVPPKM